ncbi:MAG: methyltransferase [Candidatus Schekmanbacteria bacterium]|nr:methyltransferase [Candidatus Schekmanbacteria bacterium]
MDYDGVTLSYRCDKRLLSPVVRHCLVPVACDEPVLAFLDRYHRRPHGFARTLLHGLLRLLVSDFDANAILAMYPLHLLATGQWQALLGGRPGGHLLDVGAGSGEVTSTLAPLFDDILTTEVSRAMAWRLGRRGFRCLRMDVATAQIALPPSDVVSCLNVLDRASRPLSLLRAIRGMLAPGGRLVVALPLPARPWTYHGAQIAAPEEELGCGAPTFEESASLFAEAVLAPAGFTVQAFTRAPYLSRGDAARALYVLDDAIFVAAG